MIKSLEHAQDIVDRCFCPTCGQKRTKTLSGAVCEQHRLVVGISNDELAEADRAREALSLPVATATVCPGPQKKPKRRCRFTIAGLDGSYRARADGPVKAVDTHGRVRIRTYAKLTEKRKLK